MCCVDRVCGMSRGLGKRLHFCMKGLCECVVKISSTSIAKKNMGVSVYAHDAWAGGKCQRKVIRNLQEDIAIELLTAEVCVPVVRAAAHQP